MQQNSHGRQTRKSSTDRKTDILAATLDLAFEVGPDNVTTGLIAARLGMTQPAIYKHFPKKEDIWQAVTAALCARILDNIVAAAQANDPPLATLKRLVLGHLQLVTATPALPDIMASRDPSGSLAPFRPHIHAEMAVFRSALQDAVGAAKQAGQICPTIETADAVLLLFGLIQSLVLRLIVSRNPLILQEDGERLLKLQLALMTPKGDGQ